MDKFMKGPFLESLHRNKAEAMSLLKKGGLNAADTKQLGKDIFDIQKMIDQIETGSTRKQALGGAIKSIKKKRKPKLHHGGKVHRGRTAIGNKD